MEAPRQLASAHRMEPASQRDLYQNDFTPVSLSLFCNYFTPVRRPTRHDREVTVPRAKSKSPQEAPHRDSLRLYKLYICPNGLQTSDEHSMLHDMVCT